MKLKFEDYDIRWANFDILQLMSSQHFTPKHLAYTTASLTFDSSSDCIMMTTNLFKKELKNPSYIECSVMLSCLTNICTREISVEIIDLVMGLQNHTKSVIRKKSAALLGKMFFTAPELIPNNLEKILSKIGNNEENAGLLLIYIFKICYYNNKNFRCFDRIHKYNECRIANKQIFISSLNQTSLRPS